MIDLFVYYKVREEDAARLAPRVRAMQERLACMGATCQLKRRPEASAGLQTWMEVYPIAIPSFEATVEQAAVQANLAEFIQGPRRSEVFVDLPPCA